MKDRISKIEYLSLSEEKRCRVLIEIILGKLEIWDENEDGSVCK